MSHSHQIPVEGIEFHLSDLLALLEQALAGDTVMRNQLLSFVTDMANSTANSTETRAIGRVIAAILQGERQPNLTGLRPELAQLMFDIATSLKNKGQ